MLWFFFQKFSVYVALSCGLNICFPVFYYNNIILPNHWPVVPLVITTYSKSRTVIGELKIVLIVNLSFDYFLNPNKDITIEPELTLSPSFLSLPIYPYLTVEKNVAVSRIIFTFARGRSIIYTINLSVYINLFLFDHLLIVVTGRWSHGNHYTN